MSVKFARDKCGQCGANLAQEKPEGVVEVKPHPSEPGIEEWSYAPCPSCGSAVPVSEIPDPGPEPETPPEE